MTAAAPVSPGDIIALALKDAGVIGVGQTALAEDTNQAFTRLNWMLDQWARERWLLYVLRTYSVACTGAMSYSVGPTPADIVIDPRPDRIESAFLRQTNTGNLAVDFPLEIIQARETYNLLALKNMVSFPSYVFYDSDWPTGAVYPWPLAQANMYSLFISVKVVFSEFPDLVTPINLPPEYFGALHTNLAVILRDAYDLPPKPVLIQRAKVGLNILRKANVQIPRLQMPDSLVSMGRYNIYSNQVR